VESFTHRFGELVALNEMLIKKRNCSALKPESLLFELPERKEKQIVEFSSKYYQRQ
jgi:hypothetical protein